MNKKYVLQEFMNLDYSDDLLTEEERDGNRNGTHLVVAGKIQCAGKLRMVTVVFILAQFLSEK
jgi:hypothetical protein